MGAGAMTDLAFDGISRFARGVGAGVGGEAFDGAPPLRIALNYREELRLPRRAKSLRLLSGTAWVSMGGNDHVLCAGDCLAVMRPKGGALISPLREGAILFEIS